MHHLEPSTRQKYQAFVHEFERSRKNLFQNIKVSVYSCASLNRIQPQLGTNKSIDHLIKEGSGSPRRDGTPRKVLAAYNDSGRAAFVSYIDILCTIY